MPKHASQSTINGMLTIKQHQNVTNMQRKWIIRLLRGKKGGPINITSDSLWLAFSTSTLDIYISE